MRTFHIGGTATRIIEQSEMQTKRAGIVIGSVHDGISKKVESQIDFFTEITIEKEKIESLNASVAASIVMFELFNS